MMRATRRALRTRRYATRSCAARAGVLALEWSFASAALLSACSADQIVVYRDNARQVVPDGLGGSPHDSGVEPPPSGGASNGGSETGTGLSSGGTGNSGGGGSGAIPPAAGGAGGVPEGGAGGAPPAAGAGGAIAGAGGLPGPPVVCGTTGDCPTGWFCAKLDCVTQTGICEPRSGLPCDTAALLVCGCDGVTYWNDCYRQQEGVAASTLGQCNVGARSCTTSADCAVAGASCSRVKLVPAATCDVLEPGTCWVTPSDCAATPAAPTWVPCPSGGQGQPPRASCVNTCTAVRSEQPHVAAMPGAQCR